MPASAGCNQEENPFNTLKPEQQGRYFVDDISRGVIIKIHYIFIHISHKFVPKGLIGIKPSLVNALTPNQYSQFLLC